MIKLIFTGDFFPANSEYNMGNGIASKFVSSHNTKWNDNFKLYFKDKDLAVTNLESPINASLEEADRKDFCGAKEFACFLKDIGITTVSIANNHILEQGEIGYNETIKALKINNLDIIGDNSEPILIKNINNHKIGIAAFNDIHDIKNDNFYCNYDFDKVISTIKQMNNDNCDLKIIYLHWGNEYVHLPAAWQIDAARKFIDAGANLVIGNHPHVIQPIEKYNNGLICYSLGNFIFDMFDSENVRVGMNISINWQDNKNFDVKSDLFFITKRLTHSALPPKMELKYKNILKNNLDYIINIYDKDKEKYKKLYSKIKKRNRLKQRILMKIDLFKRWNTITVEGKKQFFSRIKKRIIKK